MISILYFLYDYVVLPFLFLFFWVSSFFNEKIKKGLEARKNLFEDLKKTVSNFNPAKTTIWFHSSSMGEFEQAKPIIEELRKKASVNIAVTFFSPSGYENSKNYKFADLVTYIPLDTKKNCRKFVEILKPHSAIFMRYDIWPNMIMELHEKKIPSFLVDATLSSDSMRGFLFLNGFHKHLYSRITKILTVSESDENNFMHFDLPGEQVKAVGDTRFDRVYQKSLAAKDKKLFAEEIVKDKKIIVMGSSWEADEEVMIPAVIKLMGERDDLLLVVAPHEPTSENISKLENRIDNTFAIRKFSQMQSYNNERIIIIDSIGILLSLYYYADIAYVGGSFKQGIHNVLEPAVYGIPVLYGPKHENSQEAVAMVEKGCGIAVDNTQAAYERLAELFKNDTLRKSLGNTSQKFVLSYTGATQKIIDEINIIK